VEEVLDEDEVEEVSLVSLSSFEAVVVVGFDLLLLDMMIFNSYK
jgi:hypothetical protein